MIVKPNQTALDVVFDISGSLAGYTSFLYQLPVGERIGFDGLPYLVDVADIGQTWTPDIENLDLTFSLKVYNDEAIKKAPYGTNLLGLQSAITWGENILPSMFDRDLWVEFPASVEEVSDELKHYVNYDQTLLDVAFDLSGSLTGLPILMNQLPVDTRIGFDDLPELWEDVLQLNQTWTPDVQNQKFVFDVNVYNIAAKVKQPYGTNLLGLVNSIQWGNDFLQGLITEGDYMIDDSFDFMVDENNNYITT